MKKIFLVVSLSVFCVSVMAQKLKFNTTEHDFSNIKEENGTVTCVFSFQNKSKKAFISNVKGMDRNLRVNFSRDILSKKGKGELRINVDPRGLTGPFSKTVEVISNENGVERTYLLKVFGNVEPRPRNKNEIYGMKEGNLRYRTNSRRLELTPTAVVRDTFFFYNESATDMKFVAQSMPAAVELVYLTPSLKAWGEGIFVYQYNAAKKNDWGAVWDRISISTNDSLRPVKTFYITGEILDDFSSWSPKQLENAPRAVFSEKEFRFGNVNEGDVVKHTFTLTNEGKTTLYVRKIKTSCGCTASSADVHELEPGQSTAINATFRTQGKKNNQQSPIDVITNDPKNVKTTLKLIGFVKPKEQQ